MKAIKKFLLTILSLIIIVSLSTSCFGVIIVPIIPEIEGLPAYTLTEDYVKQTKAYLKSAKEYTIDKKTSEANTAWSNFNVSYYEIVSQTNVAFILYSSDASSQTYKDNYLFASNSNNDVYAEYMKTLQDIYKAEGKDGFLKSLSEEELARVLQYTDKVAKLEKEVSALQVEYAGILDDENFNENTVLIYKQIVDKNNQIATEYGYKNYYEYASENVYGRDYSSSDLQTFRKNVGEKLPTIISQLDSDLDVAKEKLSKAEKDNLNAINTNPYNKTEINYWQKYLNSYEDTDMKDDLNHAFVNKNVLFADGKYSREMAFTASMPAYNKRFCYFGPKYQDVFTVAHEIGHYYAGLHSPMGSGSMDLKETHSQCNEMLLLEYLSSELKATSYTALELSSLFGILSTTVVSTIVDEFEYFVYTNDVTNYTANNFDAKMNEICLNYGGRLFVDTIVSDINRYWRLVVAEQPLYYISYATSGIASINLYIEADESRSLARLMYKSLIENYQEDKGFTGNLTNAGFINPFTEEAFTRIHTFLLGNKVETPEESSSDIG
ncbi:MAG: hypothetical protein IKA99_00010 [Clostridia bacterium]|nr:hypothetical protein [Clostridia bacterium]